MGIARPYVQRKSHEKPEYGSGRRPVDFADFWQYRERPLGMRDSFVHRGYAGEQSEDVLAGNQDIRSLTALTDGGSCLANVYRKKPKGSGSWPRLRVASQIALYVVQH